jgi:serine/threonine protein kinase
MAPEIHACKNDSTLHYDAKAADMFAHGVILYALIMGRLPFEYAIPEDRHFKLLLSDPQEFWKPLTPLLAKLE